MMLKLSLLKLIVSLAALTKFSVAVPAEISARTLKVETETFEGADPAFALPVPLTFSPLPAVTALGKLNGLFYNLFLINAAAGTTSPIGVKPRSPTKGIAYSTRSQVQIGTPVIRVLQEANAAKAFKAISIYFGCIPAQAVAVGSIPFSCTIQATAYKNGNVIGTDRETFVRDGLLSEMKEFVFDPASFGNVDRIEFETLVSDVSPLVAAVLLDDFKHTKL